MRNADLRGSGDHRRDGVRQETKVVLAFKVDLTGVSVQIRPEGGHLGSWSHHLHPALWVPPVQKVSGTVTRSREQPDLMTHGVSPPQREQRPGGAVRSDPPREAGVPVSRLGHHQSAGEGTGTSQQGAGLKTDHNY